MIDSDKRFLRVAALVVLLAALCCWLAGCTAMGRKLTPATIMDGNPFGESESALSRQTHNRTFECAPLGIRWADRQTTETVTDKKTKSTLDRLGGAAIGGLFGWLAK